MASKSVLRLSLGGKMTSSVAATKYLTSEEIVKVKLGNMNVIDKIIMRKDEQFNYLFARLQPEIRKKLYRVGKVKELPADSYEVSIKGLTGSLPNDKLGQIVLERSDVLILLNGQIEI